MRTWLKSVTKHLNNACAVAEARPRRRAGMRPRILTSPCTSVWFPHLLQPLSHCLSPKTAQLAQAGNPERTREASDRGRMAGTEPLGVPVLRGP